MRETNQPSTPQLAAALAVTSFAERWEKQLGAMAAKVKCQCSPQSTGRDESDHDAYCPVGLLRQAGRLMCEEASETFVVARS